MLLSRECLGTSEVMKRANGVMLDRIQIMIKHCFDSFKQKKTKTYISFFILYLFLIIIVKLLLLIL